VRRVYEVMRWWLEEDRQGPKEKEAPVLLALLFLFSSSSRFFSEQPPGYWCRWLGMHKNTVSRFFSAVLRIEPRGYLLCDKKGAQ